MILFSPLWNIYYCYQHLTDEEMEQKEGKERCQAHTASTGQGPCADSGSLTAKAQAPWKANSLPLCSYLNFTMLSPDTWKEETPETRVLESWWQEYYHCDSGQLLLQGREIASLAPGREIHGQAITIHAQRHYPCKCGPMTVIEPSGPIRDFSSLGGRVEEVNLSEDFSSVSQNISFPQF